jgi:trans-2,3-dihydro-3-hydroxyanthranilate isomerase
LEVCIVQRRFHTLDVFTDTRFAGNPLAVVLEPDGLTGEAMQTIAREFNLPETVFVLPPQNPAHRAKLRIFTPAAELPFAGHPTVGTAVLLGRIDGASSARQLVLEEGIGPIRCRVAAKGADVGNARFDLARLPQQVGETADAARLAAAIGLELDDLGCGDYVPGVWSAGNAFSMIPVRGLDAMKRARANLAHWDAFAPQTATGAWLPAPFLFCTDTVEPGRAFHARMFAPHMGIPEDPATGSAVAAFAGVVATQARPGDGEHAFVIEQGFEMGRPSLIHLTLTLRGGKLTSGSIGGDAVVVAEGKIEA